MPFAEHYRVTAAGRLGNPQADRFQFGLNLSKAAGPFEDFTDLDDQIFTDMRDDVQAFFANAATKISADAVLDTVKFAHIGSDGKYTEDPKIYVVNTPGGVAANTFTLPQTALCISLNTDLRGPSGKGRFYIPMPIVSLVSADSFRISAATANGVNAQAEALIEALNNQPGLDLLGIRVVVASSKGFNTAVTSVRVGRVVDTIRSRRNAIPELYVANLDVD